jgi:hypothetical protein
MLRGGLSVDSPTIDSSLRTWLMKRTPVALALLLILAAGVRAELAADSAIEWSTSGAQGESGWYNGHYNQTLDPDGSYDADDFLPFAPEAWTGSLWDLELAESGPWTTIGQEYVHPNGNNSVPGEEHWAIRRWVSDVSGSVAITWTVRKVENFGCGNGVIGYLFVEGVRMDSAAVSPDDAIGNTSTVTLEIQAGDRIDVAVAPNGPDDCDGSATRLTVGSSAPVQTFDEPGMSFVLTGHAGAAPVVLPGGEEGSFLRLVPGEFDTLNTVGFDSIQPGRHARVIADFDFRMSPVDGEAGADGMSFVLLRTEYFGLSGAALAFGEEPNLAGSLGIAFDIFDNGASDGFNSNHISVHFDGQQLSQLDDPGFALADGLWHHAQVTVDFKTNGADVTVVVEAGGGSLTTLSTFVGGMAPYESRAAFGGRTGGVRAAHDLDNIRLEYQGPIRSGGWIPTDRWLLLFPLLNPHGCDAGGLETMLESWIAPHVLGEEDPKPGVEWPDIDFGGAAASSGWAGAFPNPTWVTTTYLQALGHTPLISETVSFGSLASAVPRYYTAAALQDIQPGTESVALVPNGGFEDPGNEEPAGSGLHPDPGSWSRFSDVFAAASLVESPPSTGAYLARGHVDGGQDAAGYVLWLTLEPDTEYVLSAYLWNFGDADNFVLANVDLNDAPNEAQLSLGPDAWSPGASSGYFVYANFDTQDTGTEVLVRAFYDSRSGSGTGEPNGIVGVQWDNIAVTRASDFVPPAPLATPGPGVRLGQSRENVLGLAVTYVENRTGAPLGVEICTKSDDSHQIWVNASILGNLSACEPNSIGCDSTFPVTLQPGINKLGVLVWNGTGDWKLQLRLLRAADGHVYTSEERDELAFLGTATPIELAMEEGAGETVVDSSGFGNHGTSSGAQWVRTPLGSGLRLDGIDDYVDISRAGDFTEGTIEAWVKPHDCSGEREIFSGLMTTDFEVLDCEFRVMDGDWASPTGPFLHSGSVLEPGNWYHVAASFDGSAWRLYVDGVPRAAFESSFHFNASRKLIGQYFDFGPYNWSGTIDEVRAHTRALDSDEIAARYEEDLERAERFVRGDANRDGQVGITDAVHLLKFLFLDGMQIHCRDAADANDNGVIGLGDPITILQALFSGGHPIPSPHPTCGVDPTDDTLECGDSTACS